MILCVNIGFDDRDVSGNCWWVVLLKFIAIVLENATYFLPLSLPASFIISHRIVITNDGIRCTVK